MRRFPNKSTVQPKIKLSHQYSPRIIHAHIQQSIYSRTNGSDFSIQEMELLFGCVVFFATSE